MKSYVTIAACPICKGELNMLLMDRRLKDRFEMHTVVPTDVCDKCNKKYLTDGVMLIVPQTGRLVVLKTEAFKRIFNGRIPLKRICFTDDTVLDRLEMKGGEKNDGTENTKNTKL